MINRSRPFRDLHLLSPADITSVEAKTGRGKQGFSRRKADALSRPGVVRNLLWGSEPSDIPLHPQSPQTISTALTTAGSKITLLQSPSSDDEASNSEHVVPEQQDNVTPIHGRKRNPPANSAGLLTRLTNEQLRERCKRLIVENALVKNRHEKQLYLAVGFLEWSADPLQKQQYYSPILFYPVRLINESSSENERFGHVLYNDDGIPHNNEHLRSELQRTTGLLLPEYDTALSLDENLNLLSGIFSENASQFRLDYRMNLGNAASPAGVDPEVLGNNNFARLPKDFSKALARNLIGNQNMGDLRVTLNLLGASNDYLHSTPVTTTESNLMDLTRIREFSRLLSQNGLGNVEFDRLNQLPDQIDDWILGTRPALQSELICETLEQPEITAVSLMKLAGIIELIDKAPHNIEKFLHKDLAYRGTPLLFKRARHQALMIEEELSQLQQHFHLDRLPAKSQLLLLIEELGGAHQGEIEVVDSHYFHARRQFMDISTEKPTTLSNEHKRLLNKLVKVLRFRELFVNNTEYRLALGPSYRGLKTNWNELEKIVDYAQELRQVLDSEAMAAYAMHNWTLFRNVYINTLDQLQTANIGLRNLVQIVKSYDQSTSTKAILIEAKTLSEQLREWNAEFGEVTEYSGKTANSMLQVFAKIHGLDSTNDKNVQQAKDAIQGYLKAHADAEEQVESTLHWLLSAIDTDAASIESIMKMIGKTGQDSAGFC